MLEHICIPHRTVYLFCLFFLIVLLPVGSCGSANLTPIINDACICPGDMLQFNCTAVGSGVTIWTGSAFTRIMCSSISLNHIQFQANIDFGQLLFCPDMKVSVRPLSVINDCYTSQLTLPSVIAEFNGSTVICYHDTDQTNEIGTYTIMYTTGERKGGREGAKGEGEGQREREL